MDEDADSGHNGGGLGELRDFEDMDGSFNAGDNQFNNSSHRGSRKESANYDNLNHSYNSDSHQDFIESQQQM